MDNLPVTFAATLTDEELKELALGMIEGEASHPAGEASFNRVVATILTQFSRMPIGTARKIARDAIATEVSIRWLRSLADKGEE